MPDVWERLDEVTASLRVAREEFVVRMAVAEGRHLTLIQGGMSPMGDTEDDDA